MKQSQFGYAFLGFALSRRTRKAFQEILISLCCSGIISQLVALELGANEHGVGGVTAGGIFTQEEAIGVDGGLVVSAAEAFAHFGVKLRDGEQGIGNFSGARSDEIDAAIARNHLAIIVKRAPGAGLDVESGALLLGAFELNLGLAVYGGGGSSGRSRARRGQNGKK